MLHYELFGRLDILKHPPWLTPILFYVNCWFLFRVQVHYKKQFPHSPSAKCFWHQFSWWISSPPPPFPWNSSSGIILSLLLIRYLSLKIDSTAGHRPLELGFRSQWPASRRYVLFRFISLRSDSESAPGAHLACCVRKSDWIIHI